MRNTVQNLISQQKNWSSSLLMVLCLLWITAGCSDNQNSKKVVAGSQFSTFGEDGAWCWFSDPRAVYFEGEYRRTYSGWISSDGDITIGYYDHDTRAIESHILESNFQVDDHNNPSLLITPEGKLLVFYSEHATEEPILLSRSKKSENITEWEPTQKLDLNDDERYAAYSDTYTYTNPIYLEDEKKLYLFWRGSDFKPNYAFSEDFGKTWSQGEIVILPDRKYKDRRPYLKVASNGKDKIHYAFTQGHPRREQSNSIYYMFYKDGTYNQADGTTISDRLPVEPAETDLVYDAANGPKAWIWDVAADQGGNPAIVYATFPDDSTHIYHYAKWDGSSWQNHQLVDSGKWFPKTPNGKKEPEPNYSGGISLDHENPNIVYLSRQHEDVFEIEKWVTNDGGKSWEKNIVTSASANDNVRPIAIRNAAKDNPIQFLWMLNTKYIHYTNYNSAIKMNSID